MTVYSLQIAHDVPRVIFKFCLAFFCAYVHTYVHDIPHSKFLNAAHHCKSALSMRYAAQIFIFSNT